MGRMETHKVAEDYTNRHSKALKCLGKETISITSFIDGAYWAKKQFLTDLWHDAKEEPDYEKILLGQDLDGYSIYRWVGQENNWHEFVANSTLQKWCYIDELIMKENG